MRKLLVSMSLGLISPLIGWTQTNEYIKTPEISEHTNILRFSDLPNTFSHWRNYTITGFEWYYDVNGLVPFRNRAPLVKYNGHLIDPGLFESSHLNLIQLSTALADSISIHDQPGVYDGLFIDQGLINANTSRSKQGWRVQGSVVQANPIGDPGPFRYSALTTPNVEQIANDRILGISYGGKKWYAGIKSMKTLHTFTTPEVASRIYRRLQNGDVWPGMRNNSFLANTGVTFNRHSHDLLFINSVTESFWYVLNPVGEIPMGLKARTIGLRGHFRLGENQVINYTTNLSQKRTDEFNESRDSPIDWEKTFGQGGVEYKVGTGERAMAFGFTWKKIIAKSDFGLEKSTLTLRELSGQGSWNLNDHHHLGVDLSLANHRDKVGVKSTLTNSFSFKNSGQINFSVSYIERLPAENHQLLPFWIERNFTLLEQYQVNFIAPDPIEKSKHFRLESRYNTSINNLLNLEILGFFGVVSNDPFMQSGLNRAETNFFTRSDGSFLGVNVADKISISDRMDIRVSYGFRKIAGGDVEVKDELRANAVHSVFNQMIYRPVENFWVEITSTYFSPTKWKNSSCTDPGSELCDGQGSGRTPPFFRLDLSAVKWFWERQLKFELGIRNLTGSNNFYHPNSVSYDLTMFIKAELNFHKSRIRLPGFK